MYNPILMKKHRRWSPYASPSGGSVWAAERCVMGIDPLSHLRWQLSQRESQGETTEHETFAEPFSSATRYLYHGDGSCDILLIVNQRTVHRSMIQAVGIVVFVTS